MKNSFCRICRGRFNLKYPPAAVDSIKKSIHPRTISVLISESGEVSENICWDCEETLLGFHKSISEDNEEEEPVVVDDDEILYKSLEKSKRYHRLSKETEVIQIDSSDSDPEELVVIPDDDDVIEVESARTIGEQSRRLSGGVKKSSKKNNQQNKMSIQIEDHHPRGKVFESKQCPLCPYHSGIELEVVFHIRQTHPHYIGDDLRFDTKIGDSILTRRIIFAHLWTFFECKECGKIYDRFWPHRKHITTHERKNTLQPNIQSKTSPDNLPEQTNNNNIKNILKRPFDEINDLNKSDSNERVKQIKTTNNCSSGYKKKLVVNLHKSESKPKKPIVNLKVQPEKSKSNALIRKQQLLQARRERRRQKREEEKKTAKKSANDKNKSAPKEKVDKPTFKMPTLPAPRASSVVKPTVQKLSFICKKCSKVFPGFMGWNSHMLWNHSLDEFKKQSNSVKDMCKLCDKHFSDASIFQKHMRFYHRRKNRKFAMEVNGNDNDEICCQSSISKSKDVEEVTAVKLPSVMPCNEPNELQSDGCVAADNVASLCQYCGSLVALKDVMAHESSHIKEGDVKRFLLKTKTKPKA